MISIHAPRAGSDTVNRQSSIFRKISIHAPRAGSDIAVMSYTQKEVGFQSTLPVRGATLSDLNVRRQCYISIHAPRAGSDQTALRCPRANLYFNPRSPCGERHSKQTIFNIQKNFNPRSPCGERHCGNVIHTEGSWISIHAPRAGSDVIRFKRQEAVLYFNPRSPCGERPNSFTLSACEPLFQSTLPVRGATGAISTWVSMVWISIHAPRAGSDADRPRL